jgi:hypothetical protein
MNADEENQLRDLATFQNSFFRAADTWKIETAWVQPSDHYYPSPDVSYPRLCDLFAIFPNASIRCSVAWPGYDRTFGLMWTTRISRHDL